MLRSVATVLLVAGLATIGTTLRTASGAAPAAASSASGTATSPTPLLSPRRLPVLFDDLVASHALQAAVDAAFTPDNACIAVDGAAGALARHDAGLPLAPASTQKLLTATAALAVLGPDHRFTTRAVTTAAVTGGELDGDLYIVGGGDPMLATSAFEAALHSEVLSRNEPVTRLSDLADAIVAAGITHIDGAVIGDDSRHDRLRFLPVWKPVYRTEGDIGALSALGVDHGYATPGTTAVPADPAAATAQQLVDLLVARGVTIGGGAASGTAPAGAREVAHLDSAPLAGIVAGMLTASDNWVAEMLAREIGVARPAPGANVGAAAGSTAAGTAAIVSTLGGLGIPTAGVNLLDGSGLAPGDRVTCTALLGAIDRSTTARFAAINRGLAVAGESGTLATRFVGDPLQGVLRAKTGHIDGVAALAGVIDGNAHLRFAFIVNGQFSTAEGERLQAIAARLVATYPQLPAEAVVPAPGR